MMILLVWQPVGWISLQTIYTAIDIQNYKIEIIQKRIKLQCQQTVCDGDVTLVREQIMQARRLWEDSVLEEGLSQLFTP